MEENRQTKDEIRGNVEKALAALSDKEIKDKTQRIEKRLFEFANFLEANIVLLYINSNCEVNSLNIIKRCLNYKKIVILPAFVTAKYEMKLIETFENCIEHLSVLPLQRLQRLQQPLEAAVQPLEEGLKTLLFVVKNSRYAD